jgi:hypothetical protein
MFVTAKDSKARSTWSSGGAGFGVSALILFYPRGILRGKRGLSWRCAPAITRFAIASTRSPLTRGCVRRTIAATWSGVSALMARCKSRRWFVVIVSFLSERRPRR